MSRKIIYDVDTNRDNHKKEAKYRADEEKYLV